MKLILYLTILIFIAGCSSQSGSQENHITIHFRNSGNPPQEYSLLHVRDSSLVVADSFLVPRVIPDSKIISVTHGTSNKRNGMIIGGAAGIAIWAGATVALAITNPKLNNIQSSSNQPQIPITVLMLDLLTPTAGLGVLIGYIVATDDEAEYRFDNSHDRFKLIRFAKYQDIEPPELQKIK